MVVVVEYASRSSRSLALTVFVTAVVIEIAELITVTLTVYVSKVYMYIRTPVWLQSSVYAFHVSVFERVLRAASGTGGLPRPLLRLLNPNPVFVSLGSGSAGCVALC